MRNIQDGLFKWMPRFIIAVFCMIPVLWLAQALCVWFMLTHPEAVGQFGADVLGPLIGEMKK